MVTLVFVIGGCTPFSLIWALCSPFLLQCTIEACDLWIYSVVLYFVHGMLIDCLPFEPMQKTTILSLRTILPTVSVNLLSSGLLSFVSVPNRTISETEAVLYLLLAGIGNELVYAPMHWLLHTRKLYKYHRLHHTQKAPCALGAVYCGIFEMWLANLTSIFLPLSFTSAPLQLYLVWITCAIQTTQIHHSSMIWPFPWSISKQPRFHDDHHRLVNVNYGNIGFLESVLNTKKRPLTAAQTHAPLPT